MIEIRGLVMRTDAINCVARVSCCGTTCSLLHSSSLPPLHLLEYKSSHQLAKFSNLRQNTWTDSWI